MYALALELQSIKAQQGVQFDKVSNADLAVAAAMTTIQFAEGPVMLDEFAYGRKDAGSASECGNFENYPKEGNYVSVLESKGFSKEEAVALASIEAFGVL